MRDNLSMPSSKRPTHTHHAAPAEPVTDNDLQELENLLSKVPSPLEPLDVSMMDGYLCGVLVQPKPVADKVWLGYITDVDGRALPPRFQLERLHALARKRHAELKYAIDEREWFDPWVFELAESSDPQPNLQMEQMEGVSPSCVEAVYPWVAGFATAMSLFPGLMRLDESLLTEPLSLLYRHLNADDLEDADALLAEIESLEPCSDLSEAVEGLVRATLLLADVANPLGGAAPATKRRSVKR
jgi:uncharacterized protein